MPEAQIYYVMKDNMSKTDHLLSNRAYDILNWVALTTLPALGTLYFAMASIWGLPGAEKVLGSLAALSTFIGALIKVSNRTYHNSESKYDGTMDIWTDPATGTKLHSLNLNRDPETLSESSDIKFKINS